MELLIGHFDAGGVTAGVEFRLNLQALVSRCIRNQVDDNFMAGQRLAPPVHTDMTEHPMFDLVPFAGPWWKMAHRNA